MGLAAFLGNAAHAQINFGAPGTFTDDSVIIAGPLDYAVNLGGPAVLNVGAQGITFQDDSANGNSNVLLIPNGGTVAAYNSYLSGGGTSGNTGFNSVLNSGLYNGTVLIGTQVQLNNLVVNRSYEVQLFVDDTRPGSSGNTFTVTSGATTTTPTTFAFNGGTPALGADITGTFTATSTSETFQEDVYLDGNPSQDDFQINAIVLDTTNYALGLTPGLTPNQRSVAQNLDLANLTGPLGPLISTIGNSDSQDIGKDLDQLSPEKLQVFRNVAFDNFGFTATQLDNHLASLRYGQGGFDTSGLAVLDPSDSPSMSQLKGRLLAFNEPAASGIISDTTDSVLGGVKMTDPKDLKEMSAPAAQNRWSTFIYGNVIMADVSHNIDVAHANYTTGGVTAGTDYRIDDNFAAGAMFGYGHTDATLDQDGSHARVDSYSPGIYATYADHGWYANGLAAYNYNSYGESRAIPFAGLTAGGDTHGNQFDSNLDGGYEFHCGNWTLGPTLTAQYVHLEINSFNEGGAGPADLSVNDQKDDSLRSRVGGQFRYQAECGGVTFTPYLNASWQHEFLDNSRGITSQFSGQGLGSFEVEGTDTGANRDSAMIDAGLNTQFNKALSGFVDYETQVGQSDFFAQSVQAGLKISF